MSESASDVAVVIDPARCAGHGICALLMPDRIDLDRWGYPVVDGAPLASRRQRSQARRAARACPRRAIMVQR